MQNYWHGCDWLTQAYPFKHAGTYESQILVDFMDTSTRRLPSQLYRTPVTYATLTGQKNPQGEVDEISWKNNEESRCYTGTRGKVDVLPPLALPSTPLQLAHTVSVWETDPPDVSLAISLGRQLEGGADSWRGAAGAGLAVTFGWVGGGFVVWDIFRSHVQCFRVSYDIPQSQCKIYSELHAKESHCLCQVKLPDSIVCTGFRGQFLKLTQLSAVRSLICIKTWTVIFLQHKSVWLCWCRKL